MGCKGSKHALWHGGGAWEPEPGRCSGMHVARHSVALRSSTLGTLSLDRAAAACAAPAVSFADGGEGVSRTATTTTTTMKSGGKDQGGEGAGRCRSVGVGGWCPAASQVAPAKRQRRAPRTPTKTPLRDPEEINVWELMEGLDDDGEGEEEEEEDGREDDGRGGVERQGLSTPGSPVFDPDVLAAFQEALDELSPPAPDAIAHDGAAVKKEELQVFAGVVRSRLSAFQQKIDARLEKEAPPPGPPPPPESARRVVVYLTSLRGIRQTYEDCWSTSVVLRSYGVHVDERDLSMHAGYKDELRAARPDHGRLPHVFVDGWYLGGAEEVRCMHESGELSGALEHCEMAPGAAGGKGGLAGESCGGCGGVRFIPCDECSGSCRVFVEEKDGASGAFKRCPECNENGLIRCPRCTI